MFLADSAENLQSLVGALVRVSEQYGFKLNTVKTKVMVVIKGNDDMRVIVRVGEETLQQVGNYKYPGSIVKRIDIAKKVFTKIKVTVSELSLSICAKDSSWHKIDRP